MKIFSRMYIFSAIYLVIISCEPNKFSQNNPVVFSKSNKIVGKPSLLIPIHSQGNVNLLVIDTLLVVQRREEPFFQVYSTISSKSVGSFGKLGDGPSEFRTPYLSNQVGYNQEGVPIITVYDHSLYKTTQASILQFIEDSEHIQGEKLDIGSDLLQHFYFQNEDFLWATIENGGRFKRYDFRKGESKIIPYIPKPDFIIEEELLYPIYRSAVAVNETKKLVIAAPIKLGQIDFFDLDGNYLRSTYFESSDLLKNIITNSDQLKSLWESKMYVVDLTAKEEYIYCLSYDNPYGQSRNPDIKTNSKILVFDWAGNPVKEFVLNDGRFVQSFAVDEINNTIYAYCPNEKENNLVIYKLD